MLSRGSRPRGTELKVCLHCWCVAPFGQNFSCCDLQDPAVAELFRVIATFRAKWASHAECWGEKDTPKLADDNLDSPAADLRKEKQLSTKPIETECYTGVPASSSDKKPKLRQSSRSSLAATEAGEPASVTTSAAEVVEPDTPTPVPPSAAEPEVPVPVPLPSEADAEPVAPVPAQDVASEMDLLADLSADQQAEYRNLQKQIAELESEAARRRPVDVPAGGEEPCPESSGTPTPLPKPSSIDQADTQLLEEGALDAIAAASKVTPSPKEHKFAEITPEQTKAAPPRIKRSTGKAKRTKKALDFEESIPAESVEPEPCTEVGGSAEPGEPGEACEPDEPEVTPAMQHGFRDHMKEKVKRAKGKRSGGKGLSGGKKKYRRGKSFKKLRAMASTRKRANERDDDAPAEAVDAAAKTINSRRKKRHMDEEVDEAAVGPEAKAKGDAGKKSEKPVAKAKAKANAKAKAKAKAKASPKARAKAAAAPKAKAKAKAKGKAKAKAMAIPKQDDGDAPKQDRIYNGRQWRYVVAENQVLGCISCRFLFRGCKACRSESFRGRTAKEERVSQQAYLNSL
ncbi:unnamed protein product [Symbiodinium sp. CCMP2456]|nr:unnamed protein product [Symbiodinium sp. CCMP2456]